MRWFLRGKRYRVKESSRRLRSLLVFGLGMCELEGREGTIGHLLVLLPSTSVVWRFTIMGDLLSYSKKKKAFETTI